MKTNIKDKVSNFFKWVKGTELVELADIDVSEDPVRPELDYMSQVACQDNRYGEIAVAYTVWSRKRGAGREIINKLLEYNKDIRTGTKRLITLSPLTPMATHFHISNGAKLISINSETQNFEYEL